MLIAVFKRDLGCVVKPVISLPPQKDFPQLSLIIPDPDALPSDVATEWHIDIHVAESNGSISSYSCQYSSAEERDRDAEFFERILPKFAPIV